MALTIKKEEERTLNVNINILLHNKTKHADSPLHSKAFNEIKNRVKNEA